MKVQVLVDRGQGLLVGLVTLVVLVAAARTQADGNATTKVARNVGAAQSSAEKLEAALHMARASQETLAKVHDYQATLSKRELVGKKFVKHELHLKVREQPFSVYIKYLKPHDGREVLFVDGQNNGQLLVHGSGLESLAGTLRLAPNSPDALAENRYPITMIGMSNLLQTVIEQWEAERPHGEAEVTYFPNASLGDRVCRVIQTTHPQPGTHFRFHMTRLYLEQETNLPVRVEQYAFPKKRGAEPQLAEEYTYANIRLNVGLSDADFDAKNPAYDF